MIKALYLRDFRNYHEAAISFSSSANMIWGNNAQGKTNLLEALYLFITGRSFRTPHLLELIRFDAASFYLEILFEKNGIEQHLKFSFDGTARSIVYNTTSLTSLSALLGILNGVILSPEDSSFVKGGPAVRRQFLDLLIAQANPLYLHHLCRYLKAMKQRNFLLKRKSLDTIEIWEEQMAASAAFLTHKRERTVQELENLSQTETLSTDNVELCYRSQALSAAGNQIEHLHQYFLKQFAKQRRRECELGITLCGPHRDDICLLLHHKEARQYASEGQQRSCITALKLAQWKWLQTLTGQAPLLFLDDIGVFLDSNREQELHQKMQNLGQVFISSARPPATKYHSICIKNGTALA